MDNPSGQYYFQQNSTKGDRPQLYYFLQQQSFMEQPQHAEPLFFLRIEEITARVTSAAITMIAMIVGAFIVQPERLSNRTMKPPRQSRTGRLRRRLPTCPQVRGARC